MKSLYKDMMMGKGEHKAMHPDLNPAISLEEAQQFNNAFQQATKDFAKKNKNQWGKPFNVEYEVQVSQEYIDMINGLFTIANQYGTELVIDVVGNWIWVGGDTMKIKDYIKGKKADGGLGFKWSNKKKLWYWHPGDKYRKKSKRNLSYDEICGLYGVTHMNQTEKDEEKKVLKA